MTRALGFLGATALLAAFLTVWVVRAQAANPDAGAPAPGGATPEVGKPAGANVRIVLTVLPSTKRATVFWGKKKLGAIAPHQPLVVQRPRDSGPLDLVVRAEGCVPVQTRAYTFADNKLAVKVTPLDEKNTLLGYREELPRDGGAPAAAQTPDAGAR
jgi:hypothetical protein